MRYVPPGTSRRRYNPEFQSMTAEVRQNDVSGSCKNAGAFRSTLKNPRTHHDISQIMQKITWAQVDQPGFALLSPAYKADGKIFTSGCVGSDKSGSIPESVEQQTENAIKNLQATLKAGGSSLDKVLKVLLFIKDGADAAIVNKVYASHFKSQPARSCIIVNFPNPQIKVELECVAVYEDKAKL